MGIIKEIMSELPSTAKITGSTYEGANIILYTNSKEFLLDNAPMIRKLVDQFKKRIEVRADSKLLAPVDIVEKEVMKMLPEDAKVTQVLLEPAMSLVIIGSQNPGMAIGANGENLKKIKEKLCWTPIVHRDSVIRSKITDNIRKVLHDDSKSRKKFLDSVGKRIYETKRSSISNEMWVRITFMGAARQVGRSCFLLQTPESNVLIDCGVNPASDIYTYPLINVPEFNIHSLDAVVVSHAHLDHSGFLPFLFKYGYRGPVYCTEPTRDIMSILFLDYIEVSQAQLKKGIYNSADVKETVKHVISLDYGEVTDITPDVRLTLYNAGHILGSAMCHLHIGEGFHNLLYSGDYKVIKTNLLNPAHYTFPRVETFITEATYGNPERLMEPRLNAEKKLCTTVSKIIKRKGKVLVPVLGVGRAQEVMVILEEYFRKNKINIPIYIDGMVWDITAIHTSYPSFLNSEIREKIFYKGEDPFMSKIFKRVGSKKEREKLLGEGPCVILATSGMLVGGPSVSYIKNLAEDKRNGLIFVCYQAEGSLGNTIQRGEDTVQIDGENVNIKMEKETVDLSGHADFNEIMSYIRKMNPHPRKVITVHGESTSVLKLASEIHKEMRIETVAPRPIDSLRLR